MSRKQQVDGGTGYLQESFFLAFKNTTFQDLENQALRDGPGANPF